MTRNSSGRPLPQASAALGFGAGGLWASEFLSDAEAEALVQAALEGGIRHFDTGPTYGKGRAEIRLGRALAGVADVSISTKVGTHVSPSGQLLKDYSPTAIRSSLESSLQRLGRDSIDLVLIHGPLEVDQLSDELIEAMEDIRAGGLSKSIGASCDADVAAAVVETDRFDALMMTLNIITPPALAIARDASARGMRVLAKSPLAHGFFEPARFIPRDRRQAWYLARLLRHYRGDIVRGLRIGRVLRRVDPNPPTVTALRYLLTLPFIDTAVVGTTRTEHLLDLTNAASSGPLGLAIVEQIERKISTLGQTGTA